MVYIIIHLLKLFQKWSYDNMRLGLFQWFGWLENEYSSVVILDRLFLMKEYAPLDRGKKTNDLFGRLMYYL
ncbi:hypothetical protein EUGRSUZ_K00630 [Eucalyptus grandis]|uniref:Uncharacterized protein n=2 Tax=Eucalyptus grandis TaxID=71139 RepID=A0ACC3IQW8_EUCGR|nr:hypothetical protein EUGRSUZ_K00630 [Eucalyptus grandis]